MKRVLRPILPLFMIIGLLGSLRPACDTAYAQNMPYLVKDINQQPTAPSSSDPSDFVAIGDVVYFTATDPEHGRELWKSDGTDAGTVLVKDIQTGASGSFIQHLTNVNGTLFFSAFDPTNGGAELWKSDGTTAGTVLVKDIFPGSNGSNPDFLTDVNGTLFFMAYEPSNGRQLWKSDGTDAGTALVKVVFPFPIDSVYSHDFTNVNGILYFVVDNPTYGAELWKSDGTDAGTMIVRDIWPGSDSSDPRDLINFDGTLFFMAYDQTYGWEFWKSDGTDVGTELVKDINPGSSGSALYGLGTQYLTVVNNTLFFVATDSANGSELWRSDGTTAGTVLIKDIYPGTTGSSPQYLANVNGTLFFVATDQTNGAELWKTDGTTAGTMLVKDIYPGVDSSSPQHLTIANGALFFRATDPENGDELWVSNGTVSGTRIVADIFPGATGAGVENLTAMNGILSFTASTDESGRELWALDARPVAVYTPSALSFAPTAINHLSTPLSLTITNDGYTPLTITGTSMSGVNPGDFIVNATTTTLARGASCILAVTFAPTETGDRGATLQINTNAPDAPLLSVSLSGTGIDLQDAVTLTVAVTGSGTVHSITYPATTDINCSGSCSQSYDSGRVVTLYSSDIADWSGCDSLINGDQCSVTMNSSKTVSVSFPEIPLCVYNYQCGTGFYCQKPTGYCGGIGTCAPWNPGICIELWAPVCGCNGTTYSNSCFARNAGVSIAYNGSCGVNSCYAFYESVEDGDICWGMNWSSEILYANLPKTVRIGNGAILKGIVVSAGSVEVTGLTLR